MDLKTRLKQEAKDRDAEFKIANERLELERQKQLEEARLLAVEELKKRVLEEQKAKEEADIRAKLETEQKETLRPDKEKLILFADSLLNITGPDLKGKEAARVKDNTLSLLKKIHKYITDETANL